MKVTFDVKRITHPAIIPNTEIGESRRLPSLDNMRITLIIRFML